MDSFKTHYLPSNVFFFKPSSVWIFLKCKHASLGLSSAAGSGNALMPLSELVSESASLTLYLIVSQSYFIVDRYTNIDVIIVDMVP